MSKRIKWPSMPSLGDLLVFMCDGRTWYKQVGSDVQWCPLPTPEHDEEPDD